MDGKQLFKKYSYPYGQSSEKLAAEIVSVFKLKLMIFD